MRSQTQELICVADEQLGKNRTALQKAKEVLAVARDAIDAHDKVKHELATSKAVTTICLLKLI